MIITAWNCPGPEGYPLLKEAGINTVWGAASPFDLAENDLSWIKPRPSPIGEMFSFEVGISLGDDIPVAELPILEAKIRELAQSYADFVPNLQFPVLVSATYTRLLDYLGVKSIEEYYQKFAELAPSAMPFLCHYPYHTMSEDDHTEEENWQEWLRNIELMRDIFGEGNWWSWIGISAITHYNEAWSFAAPSTTQIVQQVESAIGAGASGIGYFWWDFETIKEVTNALAERP